MKATFKPLGLAAAVAAVSAGYAGVTNAQDDAAINPGNIGDVAIIPYYTVQDDWVTGIHITNTSDQTQVVKLRMRRGSDSMDALDFNIVLSPYDMWTGSIQGEDENSVRIGTQDNSCTAPLTDGVFPMPGLDADGFGFNEGAMEGYIEIIGMASIGVDSNIGKASKHDALGIPADCAQVESNFFRNATAIGNGDATKKGVMSNAQTIQQLTATTVGANDYSDTGNVLSVSYFIRDNATGVEFGSNAVHITDFSDEPMMSNQARLVQGVYDPYGFYIPDLDGGTPGDPTDNRGLFDENVRPALGVLDVLNDWSVGNSDNQIETDWVITLPGQYLMVDFANYVNALFAPVTTPPTVCAPNTCDYRDLPVTATFEFWDREEQQTSTPEDGLVISPATGDAPASTQLPHEVNVIKWHDTGLGNDDVVGVLNSQYGTSADVSALGAENGWAELAISATTTKTQKVCELGNTAGTAATCNDITSIPVPMVGFAAWQRTLPNDLSASYGRIIDHAFQVSSDSSS